MKTIINKSSRSVTSFVFACSLFLFISQALAIEGLHLSVQSTNAVLSWPSDSSETYIIQYRHTLNATDSWSILADYYPADSSTNITSFTDPNAVDFDSGNSSGGGSFAAMATSGNEMSLATSAAETLPPAPMAIADYAAASPRPSAFVGWTAEKWITFLFGYYLNDDHVKFIGWIQYDMLANNDGIQAAINYAARQPDVTWAFVWLNQMSVYGYGGLTLGAYNN